VALARLVRLAIIATLLVGADPFPLHAHGPAIGPDELWRSWTTEWWALGAVLVPATVYATGLARLWGRAGVGRGVREWEAGCFAGGILALFVALVSPLDALGGALFSAHMVQHMVLMLVAAPLMILGNPQVAAVWSLPSAAREPVGQALVHPDVRGFLAVFGNPFVAWGIHAAAIWVWHVPTLYEATLASDAVHFAQHAAFFGSALLFWWAAVRMARRTRARHGLGIVYVFTTAVHTSLLSALLTFSTVLWYPIYDGRTGVWGLTALEDQQLGGILMWIPAGMIYLVAALALLAAGLRHAGASSRPARGVATGSGVRA
jgi:putative membrane protein